MLKAASVLSQILDGMSAESWTLTVSVMMLIVIGASAIAAIVQLRHLRAGNQLSGLITVFGMLQDPSVRELVNHVRHDLVDRVKDHDFRESLLEIPIDRQKHPELYLCDMYNHLGSFVRSGLIDERTYLQTDWYNVNLYWELLAEVIAIVRTNRPYLFENFEYLAARAKAWMQNHPQGDYPRGEQRLL